MRINITHNIIVFMVPSKYVNIIEAIILDMKSINRLYNIFLFLPSLNIIIPKPNIDIINIMLAINILITSNTFS